MTGNEWQRIKGSLSKKQAEEEKLRRERDDRLRLHQTSKSIVKNWENTIEVGRNTRDGWFGGVWMFVCCRVKGRRNCRRGGSVKRRKRFVTFS